MLQVHSLFIYLFYRPTFRNSQTACTVLNFWLCRCLSAERRRVYYLQLLPFQIKSCVSELQSSQMIYFVCGAVKPHTSCVQFGRSVHKKKAPASKLWSMRVSRSLAEIIFQQITVTKFASMCEICPSIHAHIVLLSRYLGDFFKRLIKAQCGRLLGTFQGILFCIITTISWHAASRSILRFFVDIITAYIKNGKASVVDIWYWFASLCSSRHCQLVNAYLSFSFVLLCNLLYFISDLNK